ncbi:MAG: phosphotransferase family protein [Pseudomonadales bacterium]
MNTEQLTKESWPGTISAWLADALNGFAPPFQFNLVPAGGSNLTYIVTDANQQRFVVRRPPLRARLATAHDMHREYRIMSALQSSLVPVPRMLAYCDDRDVCDADFYCMEMIEGRVIRDSQSSNDLSEKECLTATEALIAAQVSFHTVDLEAVGLSDLARHDAYLERQLKRWLKQVDAAAARDVPAFAELHKALEASMPECTASPGLAHGDYRFDNTVLNTDLSIAAVLDWELCTIGDPLADFIWSLNYWAEPGETLSWLQDPPTAQAKFPTRDFLIERYGELSGINVRTDMAWYQAFSWWKQACIVEGVYARLLKGAAGGMKIAAPEMVAKRVDDYLLNAQSFAEQI